MIQQDLKLLAKSIKGLSLLDTVLILDDQKLSPENRVYLRDLIRLLDDRICEEMISCGSFLRQDHVD